MHMFKSFDFFPGVKKAGSPKQESLGALGGLSLRRAVDAGEKELRGAGRESPTEPALCPREGPLSLDGQYATLSISICNDVKIINGNTRWGNPTLIFQNTSSVFCRFSQTSQRAKFSSLSRKLFVILR